VEPSSKHSITCKIAAFLPHAATTETSIAMDN